MIPLLITAFLEIRLLDIIDILLVALLLYQMYNILKGTAAINIFFGIISIFLMWWLVRALKMELLTEILGAFISVGFIALIVVFQPEIRRFLLLLGRHSFFSDKRRKISFWSGGLSKNEPLKTDQIMKACVKMAAHKTGALIIITHRNQLDEAVETGDILDASVSSQLLENIFFPNSPLHDGAVIIVENRIKAARCILPVSQNMDIPLHMGLRHRSAIGITERSDAIAIIVSEETGAISWAREGKITYNLDSGQLKALLRKEFKN